VICLRIDTACHWVVSRPLRFGLMQILKKNFNQKLGQFPPHDSEVDCFKKLVYETLAIISIFIVNDDNHYSNRHNLLSSIIICMGHQYSVHILFIPVTDIFITRITEWYGLSSYTYPRSVGNLPAASWTPLDLHDQVQNVRDGTSHLDNYGSNYNQTFCKNE
jgi:hypothetical protein